MKNLFSRDNFVFNSCDKKQRAQSLIVSGVLIFLFIISSFTFFNMFYGFVDMIGSIVSGSPDVAIKDFLRSVPLFLSFFMTLWTILLAHAYFRNESDDRRRKSLKKCSITVIVFASINILYIVIGRFGGQYLSLVEGSPSPLFPLDALLYSLFYLLLGIALLIYGKKLEAKNFYLVPTRGPIVNKARFGYCFFVSIWMLFALFTFSGFWMGLFIVDFIHGYLAYSISLLCVYFINFCYFAIWEFYYNELKEEKRKEILLPLSIIGLIIGVAVAVFYFVALSANLYGPSNIGFGVLPVAFAANVNIATLLVVMLPIIVSLVAFIKGLMIRK